MNTIRILSEKTASQIAAGEVIDRPASVVRELIDNSVDAGADRVHMNIENGGKRRIKVSDNGIGMSRDDLLLCIERHATSKIKTASDLSTIQSFGFRGEAIPSIASVSQMTITSRPHDQLSGNCLKISGGTLKSINEIGLPEGTVVDVKHLFFNLPVRRGFLRSARAELNQVIDAVFRAALPFEGIRFKLDEGDKRILHLPSLNEPLPRLSAFLGKKIVESMIEVNGKQNDVEIHAYLAPPEYTRSRGDRLYIYVNNRNVRDRVLTKAIMEGYGQRLMKGQYPQVVIFLHMDPSSVDVNIHPTKQEVRFQQNHLVFQTVSSRIQNALSKHTYPFETPWITGDESETGREASPFMGESVFQYTEKVAPSSSPGMPMADEGLKITDTPELIGQLGNTYILCHRKDGLLLIDQHGAHERIIYEQLKAALGGVCLEAQQFLIPQKVELGVAETKIALEKREELLQLGIELNHFGGNDFLLQSVPVILKHPKWDEMLSELLQEFGKPAYEKERIFEKVLTVMACHGAIRAGQRMSSDEMIHLLDQLAEAKLPSNCPHGRPIWKLFTFYELEKMFKRIV